MATAGPRTYEFLAVIPDKPGMREKRLEVRPKHFQGLTPDIDSGAYKMGGALLTDIPESDDPSKLGFVGSTMVLVAESREQVIEKLKADIYATSGVWDVEKAQIYPFKCAFRYP